METLSPINTYTFLEGGGEMGELTLKHNWANTSIGPINRWPQSLCTTLGILLHSDFPNFLFWGEDLTCFYNDAFRPSLGIDGKHPAIGKKGKEVWPEIWDFIGQLIEQVMKTGKPVWFENQLVPFYRNGRIEDIYWTFSYSPAYGDDGKINGVFVTCVETTQAVVTHQSLKESKEQLFFAIEAAELATWDFNPLTNTFTANERYTEWFGLQAQTETDNNMALAVIAEEDRERVIKAYTGALQYGSENKFDIEYKIRPHNKPERVLRAKGKAWFNEDKIAYRFTGTLQDVTEKTKELQAQKGLLDNILTNSSNGISVTEMIRNKKGEVIDANTILANDAAVKYTGLPKEIYLSKTAAELDPDIMNSHYGQMCLKTLATGEPTLIQYFLEITGRWLELTVSKMDDDHLIHIFTDVTPIKETQLQLERSVEDLRRSNINLEEFAYAASHDLKEPIRKIYFFTDRIKNSLQDRLTDEAKLYFERMETASKRMNALIDDLLSYSQVSLRPRIMEQVDLNQLLYLILQDLELEVEEKSALITINPLFTVQGHTRQLQQAFQNLLTNALKYSKPGTMPEIIISGYQTQGKDTGLRLSYEESGKTYHVIEVKDNGIGFEQKDADRIFNIFTRLHGNAEFRGTGVGLSIVRKVIENHHGHITAEGKPGEGALFKLYLPAEV